MDDLEGPSDLLYSELEDSVSNLAESLTHSSSDPPSLACTSTSLADTICAPSVVSTPPLSPITTASILPKRHRLGDDPSSSNFSPVSIVTSSETSIFTLTTASTPAVIAPTSTVSTVSTISTVSVIPTAAVTTSTPVVAGRGRNRRGRGRGIGRNRMGHGRGDRGMGSVRGRGSHPRIVIDPSNSTDSGPPPYRSSCETDATGWHNCVQFNEPVGPTQPLPATATAIDFFMQMFDEDLFKHIVEQTNLYASLHPPSAAHYEWYDTSVEELKAFFGTVILMGITKLPSIEDYWSTVPELGAPHIVRAFPINRFKHIIAALHFNDNSTALLRTDPNYDKLHKVRPVIESILSKCKSLYNPGRENSVDEAMVGFKGRSSLKQYMPDKPTKRGFKIWCSCDSKNSYTSCFQVYTGKVDGVTEKNLGANVVKRLSEDIYDKGYYLFFDNFFANPILASDLLAKQTYCVGTVKTARVGFPNFSKTQLGGLERGEDICDLVKIRDESVPVCIHKVHCFVWQDSKPVAFMNTICNPNEITKVKRKQKDGTSIDVSAPTAVKLYNDNMGGVDLADQMRKAYTCTRKSKKKWYMRLFWYLLDLSIVNAYILECESPNHLPPSQGRGKKKKNVYRTQKLFILELARELIGTFSARKSLGRPLTQTSLPGRYTEHHMPTKFSNLVRCKQCHTPDKIKRTQYGCLECGVHLCPVPCFRDYHTKN